MTKQKRLTQEQLVAEIAKTTHIPQRDVKDVLRCYGELMLQHTTSGTQVPLPYIGRFSCRQRQARSWYAPGIDKKIESPEGLTLIFKTLPAVKAKINEAAASGNDQ